MRVLAVDPSLRCTGFAVVERDGKNLRALLGLTETPQSDAADALALALTHLQNQEAIARGVVTLKRV